ncbi:glycosyltransferase family 4 protein [Peribacillus alkalitolerans]|uniref:glycosyltransferase family 4 protein n=1 Tax=Peribacillus alkalitolerans TaxID=1550385 RepID=UPI0013D7DD8F|nr:glycosyltransferase family 4 protein [Peribacillus alkalitolerans]
MIQELRTKEFNNRLKRIPFTAKQLLSKSNKMIENLHVVYAMTHVGICGGVKVIFEHANRLKKAGAKVTLVSHFPQPSWFPIEAEYIQVSFDLELAKGIPDCDLIVATYWDHIQASIETGIAPVVYFEQGDFHLFDYETMNFTLKNFIQMQFEIVPFIYTVSNQASELITKIYGREAQCYPNAVDETVFSAEGEKVIGERPYLLMVGGESSAFKGIPDIIAAYEKIKKELDMDLYWITPEQPTEKLKARVTRVFVNPSQKTISNLYRGAALYVCGSSYENFPLPPLEAMACGCPVVTTDNRGSLEYAVHRKNAYICKMKDPDDMAAKIAEVFLNQSIKKDLIKNGLSTAKLYRWETIINDIYEYYRMIASHKICNNQEGNEDWEIVVQPKDFFRKEDYAKFKKLLKATKANLIKVPVIYDVEKIPLLARWEVIAHRKNGGEGLTEHCFAPIKPLNKLELFNFPGYGSFLSKEYEKALEEFQHSYEQTNGKEKEAAARWLILTLLRLQRKQEAKKRLNHLRSQYPHNADFYLLEMMVYEDEEIKKSKQEFIRVLGEATSCPEFFFDVQKLHT